MKKLLLFVLALVMVGAGASGVLAKGNQDVVKLTLYHWDFSIDQESEIYRKIREEVGVEIEVISAPWPEWQNKLNIMVASGDMPDIFVTYGPGDADGYERYAKEGLLLPLSPYFVEYPHIEQRLQGRENQMIAGEYYGVPVQHPKSDHVLMVRGDWLAESGLRFPETTEELYHLAKYFQENYCDYPITSSPPHTSGLFWLNPLFYAFGGGWETWVETEDGYVISWVSEGNKEALKYINKMYQARLLDPEFVVNTDSMKMDKFLSGEAGIVFHNSIGSYNDKMKQINPEGSIAIGAPVQGPEGHRGLWAMDGFFTAVSINNRISEEKKRKALELMDYLYSAEGLELLRYGVEGIHYQLVDGERQPVLPEEQGVYVALRAVDPTVSLKDFVELGGTWLPEWNTNHAANQKAVNIGEEYGQVPMFLYEKSEAEEKYGKQLVDLVFREYVRLVKSDEFEQDWEKFVSKFMRYGGEKIMEEVNGGE